MRSKNTNLYSEFPQSSHFNTRNCTIMVGRHNGTHLAPSHTCHTLQKGKKRHNKNTNYFFLNMFPLDTLYLRVIIHQNTPQMICQIHYNQKQRNRLIYVSQLQFCLFYPLGRFFSAQHITYIISQLTSYSQKRVIHRDCGLQPQTLLTEFT